jgi:hypothetical protein
MIRITAAFGLVALTACAPFPDVAPPEAAAAARADYPALRPLSELLAAAETDPRITPEEIDALLARSSRVQARRPDIDTSDLAARAERLRQKAAALRAAPPA